MSIPTALEIRKYLENYGIETTSTYSRSGTLTISTAIVTIDTQFLQKDMRLSGTGIPAGTRIFSIDSETQLTMDADATASGAQTITITYYDEISDAFIEDKRDLVVIPWIEARIRRSITANQTASEIVSGNGTSLLYLNRRGINSLTNITYIDGIADINLIETDVASYELLSAEGIIKYRNGKFPKGERNIKVEYTYGITAAIDSTYERRIMYAVKLLVSESILAHMGNRTGGGDLSVQSHSRSYGVAGKYSHIRKKLYREAMSILSRYMDGVVS